MSYTELTWAQCHFKGVSSKAGWLREIEKERVWGLIRAALAEDEIRGQTGCTELAQDAASSPCPAVSSGDWAAKVSTSRR